MRALLVLLLAVLLTPPAAAKMENHGLQAGQNLTLRFDETAEIPYHCHPHPKMVAHLSVVADRAATNETVRLKDLKFVPESLTVGVGSNVTFVNEDQVFHTVTATPGGGHEHGAATPGAGVLALLAAGVLAGVAGRRRA